jgi:hypothetical protein
MLYGTLTVNLKGHTPVTQVPQILVSITGFADKVVARNQARIFELPPNFMADIFIVVPPHAPPLQYAIVDVILSATYPVPVQRWHTSACNFNSLDACYSASLCNTKKQKKIAKKRAKLTFKKCGKPFLNTNKLTVYM